MSEQRELLVKMNLEIQQERFDVKEQADLLSYAKKKLKEKETQYLKLSLQEFEDKK